MGNTKKKIVVFYEDAYHGVGCTTKDLEFDSYEKINYDKNMQKDLEYFASNKDSRIYSGVLDYCEIENIDHLYLTRLHLPEFLLMELMSRNNIKTRISFMTEWRVVGLSAAKSYCFSELLKHDAIKNAIVFSQLGKETRGSEFIGDNIYNSPKIKHAFDMLPAKINILDREKYRALYKYTKNDFVVLFFGSMLFGKGIDIFTVMIDMLKNVKDLKFIISSSPERLNFDFDYEILNDKTNAIFFDTFVTQDEMSSMYSACDCVAMPYKNSYKYGSSNILTHACYYKKPVVSSNVYPIGDAIRKYNLGITYENADDITESALRLASKVLEMKKTKQVNCDFDGYISNIQSWEEFSKMIIGD